MKNNTKMVRKINSDVIRKVLRKNEELTKAEISSLTGLSIATCGNLLKLMVESGEVIEGELEQSTGGRPARRYRYNVEKNLLLCLYVIVDEKERLLVEVNDGIGSRKEMEEIDTDKVTESLILEKVNEALEKYENISYVGIGIPGTIHEDIIEYSDADQLIGVNLKASIEAEHEVKVFTETEQCLKAYGYCRNHKCSDDVTMAYIVGPRDHCLGSGLIIHGKIYRGSHSIAGEIQYLPYHYFAEHGVDMKGLMDEASVAAGEIIALLNPDFIVISGEQFDENTAGRIKENCQKFVRKEYIPEIYYEQESYRDFREGLVVGTLKQFGGALTVSGNSIFQ